MRIVFMGASKLGYQCCEALIKTGQNVVGILTMPKKFEISYSKDTPVNNVLHEDFHVFEKTYNIPVIEVTEKMKNYTEQIAELRPDFILVIGWYYMIPKSIRELPPKGCAGIHGSLLPKYRGGAPLVWAMINGEKEAGVSFFYFEKGVDDGDIIAQRSFSIEENETIADVLQKATAASIDIVKTEVPKIANETAERIVQDHTQATHVPQRNPGDGEIDWTWDTQRIRNFIRAQTRPYPGAFTVINNKKVTLWDADIQ